MKKIQYVILIIFISVLYSCEKVIDVDLNTANSQYVIQSVLYAGEQDFIVNISQTTSYFSPSKPEVVKNANISLIDDNGHSYNLVYEDEGSYLLSSFEAESLKEYTLKVVVEGKPYEATAGVAQFVPIDSVKVDTMEDEFDGYVETGVRIWFTSYSDKNNYYQIKTMINNQIQENNHRMLIGEYDAFESINSAFIPIYESPENGDIISVELIAIDKNTFQYFNSLDELSEGGLGFGGASPANPKSNWSNGALGYFGTGNSDFISIVWENNSK